MTIFPSALQEAADIPMGYRGAEAEKLRKIVMPMFLGGEATRAEKNYTFRSPTFNYSVDKPDCRDCNSEVGRLSSFNKSIIDPLEKEEYVAYKRVLPANDV